MSLNQQGMLDEGKDRTDGSSSLLFGHLDGCCRSVRQGTLEQYLKEDELFQN